MPGDYFWECVEALAASFDGDPKTVDEHLNTYAQLALGMPPEKRAQIHRDIVKIIGGLAQLKSRLAKNE